MHSDSKKRRSSFLVAMLFAAGDLRSSAATKKIPSVTKNATPSNPALFSCCQ